MPDNADNSDLSSNVNYHKLPVNYPLIIFLADFADDADKEIDTEG